MSTNNLVEPVLIEIARSIYFQKFKSTCIVIPYRDTKFSLGPTKNHI